MAWFHLCRELALRHFASSISISKGKQNNATAAGIAHAVEGRSINVCVPATLLSKSCSALRFHYKCQRHIRQEVPVRMLRMSLRHIFKGTNPVCQKNIMIQDMIKSILQSHHNTRNRKTGDRKFWQGSYLPHPDLHISRNATCNDQNSWPGCFSLF